MVDSVYRTRSLGVATPGLPDQYADGVAATVWEYYIGTKSKRTENYKRFLCKLLKDNDCHHVLDVACGTGVDSIMLLEEGFNMKSVDASDKMLKYALNERWRRRKDPRFDAWEIEEANWLTLTDDINKPQNQDGYDAVICLGNSFAHLPNFDGTGTNQRTALHNMAAMVRTGGFVIIDHRNYDYILDTGKAPKQNIYYNSSQITDINTSILYMNGYPNLVTLDYTMDLTDLLEQEDVDHFVAKQTLLKKKPFKGTPINHFRLSYYPHRLEPFKKLLKEAFDDRCTITVYGDFKPLDEISEKPPAFYIHLVKKLGKEDS